MKVTKTEGIILAAAIVFVVFTSGYFVGRHSIAGSFTVETQSVTKALQSEAAETSVASAPPTGTEETAEIVETTEVEEKAETEDTAGAVQKININTADAALLETLPGIGEKRAQGIIAYREQNGSFRYVEQIVEVSGIGEAILEDIADLITVGEEGGS